MCVRARIWALSLSISLLLSPSLSFSPPHYHSNARIFTFQSQNCNDEMKYTHSEGISKCCIVFLFLNLDHESVLKWNGNETNHTEKEKIRHKIANRNDNDNSNSYVRILWICTICVRLLCDRQSYSCSSSWPQELVDRFLVDRCCCWWCCRIVCAQLGITNKAGELSSVVSLVRHRFMVKLIKNFVITSMCDRMLITSAQFNFFGKEQTKDTHTHKTGALFNSLHVVLFWFWYRLWPNSLPLPQFSQTSNRRTTTTKNWTTNESKATQCKQM